MSSPAGAPRRARLLVSGAAVAAAAAAVFLALLVAALVGGRGAGSAAAHGLAAAGATVLAVGLLVLARAGAVAPGAPERARSLCTRCMVGVLLAAVAIPVAGAVAVMTTRTGTPVWGAAVGTGLLAPLAGLAVRLRTTLRGTGPPDGRGHRSGGGGESEPDPVVDAR